MSETPMTPEQRAAIAALIGDAKPATTDLLMTFGTSVRDRREHDHTTQREDWYCLNLSAFMGERMAPVLRRLLDAEARVAELDAERHSTNESLSEAAEQLRRDRDRIAELEVAAIEGRAALAALCHDLEDPGSIAFGALFLLQQATPGTPMEPGEPTPTVYRASHDSIVMGFYTTAAAARAHCEASAREAISGDISLDWIEDEEDGVAELAVTRIDGSEYPSGYVVTALEVAASYDEEADE